jgi:hypothetical protein
LASKPSQRFLGLGIKTKVDGLGTLASKSSQQFVDLHLKTNEQMKMV